MNNSTEIKNETVNLSDVQWNKLTVDEFIECEKTLQRNNQILKDNKDKKRVSGNVTITIRGKQYDIPAVMNERLKKMKSEKSRDKLLSEIVAEFTPKTIESF